VRHQRELGQHGVDHLVHRRRHQQFSGVLVAAAELEHGRFERQHAQRFAQQRSGIALQRPTADSRMAGERGPAGGLLHRRALQSAVGRVRLHLVEDLGGPTANLSDLRHG